MGADAQLINLLMSLVQTLDPAQAGMRGVRAIVQNAIRMPVNEEESVADLASGPLLLTTQASQAWDAHVIAVRFGNTEPRTVRISLVMGDIEYSLVNEEDYTGDSIVVTDSIKLNTGDQVRVYVDGGTGTAHAHIRGEIR